MMPDKPYHMDTSEQQKINLLRWVNMGRMAVLCNHILHDYVVYLITYLCLFILFVAPDNALSLCRNNDHCLVALPSSYSK